MLDPLPQESWSRRAAIHLLNRAGFGGSPDEQEALFRLGEESGIEAAVDSLLETSEDWSSQPWPDWALRDKDPNGDFYDPDGNTEAANSNSNFRNQGIRRREFTRWYFASLKEGQPLAAKLLKFFTDHFAIDSAAIGQYYRFIGLLRYFEILRKHAAGNVAGQDAPFEGDERLVPDGHYGNFRTMVNHVSWSIAMVRTLDLYVSTNRSINENFGRELLELFTLGVGDTYTNDNDDYTEEDVGTAAEAFTGRKIYNYRYPNNTNNGPYPAAVWQNNGLRDKSAKSFFGNEAMPGGADIVDGDDIIELIFNSTRCAKHLSWKLWRYFASPNPSKELVAALALRFRDTHDYEIRPFLKDIFLSQEFYDDSAINSQVKDAGDILTILEKQLEAPLVSKDAIEDVMQQLGYEILFPPSIAGWPEPDGDGNTWLATGSMVFRMNMPSIWSHRNFDVLTNNRVRNSLDEYPEVDWNSIAPRELRTIENFPLLIDALTKRFLPNKTLRKSQIRTLYQRYSAISEQLDSLEGVKELIRLLLALPEYQLQ
ncbi:MAG: DUF1800 family protein [Opitutales bacterium]|nr:DUF1800 family protein [Opitutales bacterium]